MIRLYLDSANLGEIGMMISSDAISGVTTNPSLISKEAKGGYDDRLHEICNVIRMSRKGRVHLSVEVTTLDPTQMISQALHLSNLLKKHSDSVDPHVKIPVMLGTLPVISRLANSGVRVNATACMTALQAKMAEDAGASVVSFFFNRMKDGGIDAAHEFEKYARHLRRSAEVICGSIRSKDDIYFCWQSFGRNIAVTAPLKIIRDAISHPKTDEAILQFQRDIEEWLA